MVDQPVTDIQRSSRDLEQLRVDLETWLVARLPAGAHPQVPELQATSTNGMSSETLLFQATWSEDGDRLAERLVARIAPAPADVPVFPTYDLEAQYRTIRRVGELSTVPVPPVWWYEGDASVIGAPFFVMGRVDGEVPPDVMPYNFGDSWLFDASSEEQRRLQDATVEVIADLHAIASPEEEFGFLALDDPGDTPLRRRVARTRAWYDYAVAGGTRSLLIERGFEWLNARWPPQEGPTVLSWGDARIGNVLYRDLEPVAVLDWEMAALAPRELDVAWLVYGHRMFEDLAQKYGLPGMPHFLRRDDVAARYAERTGYELRDLDWYERYAALQIGIVGLRTGARAVHFGEREMPDDVDELMFNRAALERMFDGDDATG
jgi:aminoglycoside phosphotransferase (APT) family kinase protein